MRLRRVLLPIVGLGALYFRLLRGPVLNWGATDAEAGARLPGDELLEQPDVVATRAITIEAPASAVWPWIAQMGPGPRGGAYTYDSRNRFRLPTLAIRLGMLPVEPASLVMERKMLRGIRKRAERLAAQRR